MPSDHARGSHGLPGLPPEVVSRITGGLLNGDKVVACLATAARLLELEASNGGLRFAESAAYNLREALDAVVSGRGPVDGGWNGAHAAWRRFQLARSDDEAAALGELTTEFERLSSDADRQAFMTRRLLDFLQERTGIQPLPGANDPAASYTRLRSRASAKLHSSTSVGEVAELLGDIVGWLVRMFTPPDNRVDRLAQLASSRYDQAALGELRELIVNAHHVRLFLSLVQDPAWLEPLRVEGFISCPRPGQTWPVSTLADAGNIGGTIVAGVLVRLLEDVRRLPKPDRAAASAELMRVACRLGPAGYDVALSILKRYPSDRWIAGLAISLANEAPPEDEVQIAIADTQLGTDKWSDGAYRTRTLLEHLLAGLTPDNAQRRVELVAVKIRAIAKDDHGRFHTLDTAALDTPGDDLRDPIDVMAHYLVQMIESSRDLGVTSAQSEAAVSGISGELGQRLVSRVMAGAEDVGRQAKVDHVASRLLASRATGDDKILIDDILRTPLSRPEAESWRSALGPVPEVEAAIDVEHLPLDWLRVWRWSILLPAPVLDRWEPAINACNAVHGALSKAVFDTRVDRFAFASGSSPYGEHDLAELAPLEAAEKIGAWRPQPDDRWGVSARELARTLENIVRAAPREWAAAAREITTALREPVYIDHYMRALASEAKEVRDLAPEVLDAVKLARAQDWTPTVLGDNDGYDYEPDWSGVDLTSVALVGALANADAVLEADLDYCWDITLSLLSDRPPGLGVTDDTAISPDDLDDPLNTAINRSYGSALETVLALGGRTYRGASTTDSRLTQALDEVLSLTDEVGLQLRAIVASRRPFVEAVAHDWLEENADALFVTPPLGRMTLDLTLKWARPTACFLDRYRTDLITRTAATERATSYVLHGMLWDRPGFDIDHLLDALRGRVSALASLGTTMASLLQTAGADDPALERGLTLWERLVEADASVVPDDALSGLGRWALNRSVDDARWLDLMDRTLTRTKGRTDLPIEVADRCADTQPSAAGLRMLELMLPHGEPWESQVIAETSLKALRTAAAAGPHPEFSTLRDALIERGRPDAAQIKPDGCSTS